MKGIVACTAIILLILCGCSTRNCLTKQENIFLESFGNEDFSKFKGCTMIYRGIDEEKNKLIVGVVPKQKEDYNNLICINLRVKDKNSFRLEVLNNDNVICKTDVDTAFICELAERFLDFDISELRVDTDGNVSVAICEDELDLFMFVNEQEMQKRGKEVVWEKICDNWYKPSL